MSTFSDNQTDQLTDTAASKPLTDAAPNLTAAASGVAVPTSTNPLVTLSVPGASARRPAAAPANAAIQVGSLDRNGEKVTVIYAEGDDFVIYSVDPKTRMSGMRTVISDSNPDRIRNYQAVKVELNRVKSLASHCDDPGVSVQIAQAISGAIYGDTDSAKKMLNNIADQIRADYREHALGKLSYMSGTFALAFVFCGMALLAYLLRTTHFVATNTAAYQVLLVTAFSTLGCIISVSANIGSIVVDSGFGRFPYFFYGAERSLYGIAGAVFVFIVIKCNLFFGFIANLNNVLAGLCAMGFLAGFSEKLVPNTLNRLDEKAAK